MANLEANLLAECNVQRCFQPGDQRLCMSTVMLKPSITTARIQLCHSRQC